MSYVLTVTTPSNSYERVYSSNEAALNVLAALLAMHMSGEVMGAALRDIAEFGTIHVGLARFELIEYKQECVA